MVTDAAVAIANLVYSYAERVDLGDFAGVAELFAHGTYRAVVRERVVTFAGAEEVEGAIGGLVHIYDGVPATKHVTTNLIIEADESAGTATCRSYYTVFQAAAGAPLEPVIAGRYHDRFELADGEWRFSDRLIYSDLLGDLSRHLRGDPYRA